MSDDDRNDVHIPLALGLMGTLPIILNVVAGVVLLLFGIGILVGRIGAALGGLGLLGALVMAVVSAVMKRRRFKRAMRESDIP